MTQQHMPEQTSDFLRSSHCLGDTCREMDVSAFYREPVRVSWSKVTGQLYQSKIVDVELNLNYPKDDTQRWIKVRSLFAPIPLHTSPTTLMNQQLTISCG